MLSTDFFNQSLNSTLIEALMVSTSNYEMRDSLFLGIDASFNLKFRIAKSFLYSSHVLSSIRLPTEIQSMREKKKRRKPAMLLPHPICTFFRLNTNQ